MTDAPQTSRINKEQGPGDARINKEGASAPQPAVFSSVGFGDGPACRGLSSP